MKEVPQNRNCKRRKCQSKFMLCREQPLKEIGYHNRTQRGSNIGKQFEIVIVLSTLL